MVVRRVLFVCTGNICRSPLAEHLFRRLAAESGSAPIDAASAGLDAIPGDGPVPATLRAGLQHGVDLSGHRAKRLVPELVQPGDLLLVMETSQVAPVRQLTRASHAPVVGLLGRFAPGPLDIADPGGLEDAAFEACVRRIAACVAGLLAWLSAGVA